MDESKQDYYEQRFYAQNKYEDILDVFINISILRLPNIFVFINMTLIIWLVQTIYSSWTQDSFPRSFYFYAPLLQGKPITHIYYTKQHKCELNYQQLSLKTFPSISDLSIKHLNLTKWRQSSKFCIMYSPDVVNFSRKSDCQLPMSYCSGICVNSSFSCPITGVRKLIGSESLLTGEKVFYQSNDKITKYAYSKDNEKSFVLSIKAQYDYHCANEYHYYDNYQNFEQFWQISKTCSSQGTLSPDFYHPFDSISTEEFYLQNGIWSQNIIKTLGSSATSIGYLTKIKFKENYQCNEAEKLSMALNSKIQNGDIESLFSKTLLIVSFILFTLCWIWLLVFYCFFDRHTTYKNIPVIILAVVQFIVITFIYSQNKKTLQFQNTLVLISKCVEDPSDTFKNWSSRIQNRQPLIAIIFCSTCFLLLQFISYFINFFIYESYEGARKKQNANNYQGSVLRQIQGQTISGHKQS